MSPLVFAALALAGGVGAALRLIIDGLIRGRIKMMYPLGTTVINISGSLILGLLTGLALAHILPEPWSIIIGTGMMGGYTTFSTASFETVRLAQDREYAAALTNGLGMLVGAVLASLLGLWIGFTL